MPASAEPAIVVDVQAELIPHPNGPKFVRMVLNPANAKALRDALNQREEQK